MEAPRGAREPTGTNGPTLNNNTHPPTRVGPCSKSRNHYTNHDQPTPPTPRHNNQAGHATTQTPGGRLNNKTCGGHSTGETPSTIPNLEAKPGSANGTATDRLWESRTPPQHTKQADRDTPTRGAPRSAHTHPQTTQPCRPSPKPHLPPHRTRSSTRMASLNARSAQMISTPRRAQE